MNTRKLVLGTGIAATALMAFLGLSQQSRAQNLNPFDKDSVVRKGLRDSDPFTPGSPANKLVVAIRNGITGNNGPTQFHGYNKIIYPTENVIINVHTGLVLDYKDKEPDAMGCYLEVAKNNEANKYQKWTLVGNFADTGGVIANSHTSRVLDYHDKGSSKWHSYLEECKNDGKGNKYQQWRVVPVGEGQVLIENIESGRVLDYKDSGNDQGDVYLEKRKGEKGNTYQRWVVVTLRELR